MNKNNFLPFIFAISTLLVISLLSGCFNESDDTEPSTSTIDPDSEEQVVNLAFNGEIPTLRSNGQIDGLSSTMMSNIFEGLYRYDENSEPVEGIASDYDVEEDGYLYTFYLREDAKWSNGTPVTAHDFVYAWRKVMHPDTISPHANLLNEIENARDIQDPDSDLYGQVEELGVVAVDDYTLEVRLDIPIPYFNTLIIHPVFLPQNEEFTEEQGENYALEPEYLISNGPFTLDEWVHDDFWVLKRNDEYWDKDNVKVNKINFNVVEDDATAVNLYEVGDIDVVNISSDFIDLFEDDEDLSTSVENEMYFLRLNQKNEYLANVNIRKAIDMGWDKEEAAETILKNGSKPINYIIPEEFAIGPKGDDFREKYREFNAEGIEKAKEYWKKGLEELGVENIELELLSYDDEQRSTMAEYIQNQLQNNLEGLTLKIHQQPNKVKLDLEDKLDYDISHSGWRGSVQDPTYFLNIWVSDGPYNWQEFENDLYDELIYKAETDLSNPEDRFEEMREAERILIEEEVAISPMYQTGTARLIKPHISGFVAHPNNTFSYKWLYVEDQE